MKDIKTELDLLKLADQLGKPFLVHKLPDNVKIVVDVDEELFAELVPTQIQEYDTVKFHTPFGVNFHLNKIKK